MGLVNLRARTYNPRLGAFTNVDPVLGVGGSTGWNGYLYANANPANLTDPSGECPFCVGVLFALIGGMVASTALKYADVIHQVDVKTRFEGKPFTTAWDEIDWNSVQQTGQVGTFLGVSLASGNLAALGARWLAANPMVAGGLIGAELEWGRQFSVNTANGMDVFHAGYHENLDVGEIAKSAFWSALTAGIWNKTKVFSAIAKNGFRSVLNPRVLGGEFIPELIPTATIYGSLGSAASSIVTSAVVNRLRGQSLLHGFTWSNFFSSTFWGGATGALTANYQVWTNPISRTTRSGAILRPALTGRWGHRYLVERTIAYAGIGIGMAIPQGLISIASGSNGYCVAGLTPFSGLANVASAFESSWFGYLASGFIASTFTSVRASQLCTQ